MINSLFAWCQANNKLNLLAEWDYQRNGEKTPQNIAKGSDYKASWICPQGHRYISRVANRTTNGHGCPYCSGMKTLPGFNDLKTWCIANGKSELIDEWDKEKNEIDIDKVSPHNSKKFWWKCPLGHEWEASLASRIQSKRIAGCPYCSNPPKKILIGFNDFASWCEKNNRRELLTEWDYEKNTDVVPTEVSFGSGKSVWWKCRKGHEWKAQICNRTTSSKTNCPICARTQTSFPEQTIAYYLTKIDMICPVYQRFRIRGYEIDIYIPKYQIGIEYDGSYFHGKEPTQRIEKLKDEALNEAGIKLIRIKETNSRQESVDSIIYFPASGGRYITSGFDWAIRTLVSFLERSIGLNLPIDIDLQRDELSIRAYYMDTLRANSVATVYPELVVEWDVEKNKGVTADTFSARNNKKVWWRCSRGHSWMATINSRTVRKLGCPYCAGQKTIYGENDLVTWCKKNKSTLLSEWDYEKNDLSPQEYQKTSNKKVWWICKEGHEWRTSIANRVVGTGCPICNKPALIMRSKTSFRMWCEQNNHVELLDEWDYEKNDGDTPDTCSYGSHKKVWWHCRNGHEWQAVIKSRTYGHGCPYCSPTFKRAIAGENDLVTWCKANNREYILQEWDGSANEGLSPEMFTYSSHKRVYWKCKNGHEWEALIKDRTRANGNNCPVCRKNELSLS